MRLRYAAAGLFAGLSLCQYTVARAQSKTALTSAQIDQMIRAEWNKEGIVPAPAVDDARFLRRIYLDIVGVIPPSATMRAFLADTNPDKRARAVDALLASGKYADNWTAYWDGILMGKGRTDNAQIVDRSAFKQWLRGEFQQNVHWNKFVYDLITAQGVNSEGGSYAKALGVPQANGANPNMAGLMMQRRNQAQGQGVVAQNQQAGGRVLGRATPPNGAGGTAAGEKMASGDDKMMDATMTSGNGAQVTNAALPAPVNGATNWTLRFRGKPEDLSGTASKLFLGVQIQCAQCHDHKTEKWKQDDFRRFTACFINARPVPVDPTMTAAQLKGQLRQVNLVETRRPPARLNPRLKQANDAALYAASAPAALDGTDFTGSFNRRASLAEWMTSPNNAWFAKAIVNRMWNHFLGRGFIEPIDDIRPSNPVIAPALLDKLAADFVANDYDLKHLIREICATQVYQLSSTPAKKADLDNKLWARYRLKPMGPDELMDSLVEATNMGPLLERVAGGRLDQIKYAMSRQFTFLFDVDEEFEQKDFEGTIPQALMLLNGNLVNRGATPIPGTALADVLASNDTDEAKIEELYLRTLSRKPTSKETARWLDFIHAPRPVVTASETNAPPAGPAFAGRRAARFNNGFNNGNNGNNNGLGVNNNAPAASGNNNTLAATPADRKALAQAVQNRKKGSNNGYDPLARFAPRASAISQTPEAQAYEDMFWALLNSSEFTFNH